MLLEYKLSIADFALNCDTLNLTIFTIHPQPSLSCNLSTKTKLSTKKSPKLIVPKLSIKTKLSTKLLTD